MLSDVYGSRWITRSGSVRRAARGEAGDPVVDLRHLKQPATEVGPFRILIDHAAGAVETAGTDALADPRSAPGGLTARDGARVLYGKANPKPADVEVPPGVRGLRQTGPRSPHAGPAPKDPITYVATEGRDEP